MPDPTAELPWWRRAVFYQIYPRSFCDSDGDGVGDLAGIESHLDHLVWLGVDAIWLSPFFRSPMADFGYDVADYCDVDPLFGSLADFDRLLAACHDRGLRMIIDWVPNHTSDEHPWFVESRATKNSAKRDWYVWRDGTRDEPPNNWRAQFPDGQAWTWDEATSQWYLHLFTPEQPDLDWDNPEVEAAMHDTLRFWLDRGVDGFRMDVVHLIGKDPALADLPEGQERSAVVTNDEPVTHERLRRAASSSTATRASAHRSARSTCSHPARSRRTTARMATSCTWRSTSRPCGRRGTPTAWEANLAGARRSLDPIDAWPTWVLSNHDVPRHRTRYGSEARARSAAVLLLTLRGTPFVYAGEELGLEDAVVPPGREVDPGGRDGCRAPIPWDDTAAHGWRSAENWLPWPPDVDERSVARQRDDPHSTLALYRRLLSLRRSLGALTAGELVPVGTPVGVLAYERRLGDERVLVAVNFSSESQVLVVDGAWSVAIDSAGAGAEGQPFDGQLAADRAVIAVVAIGADGE
ncbi:MAG: alpha-amylase family glycosyl hydrolase [Ilumatobacteraceae bacterium]